MQPFYGNWDEVAYHKYLQAFSLEPKQKFKTMSKGMKIKLGMAVTLSHNARLFIPLTYLINAVGNSHFYLNASQQVFLLVVSCLSYSIANISMFPILFKLGYEKGKFFGFYLPIICFGVLYVLLMIYEVGAQVSFIFIIYEFATQNMILINMFIMFLAIVILLISYMLSIHFYKKRDF